MGVREQNRVDPMRIDREAIPIAQTQCLEALEQAAIDQQPTFGIFNEILEAGNDSNSKKDKPKPTLTSSWARCVAGRGTHPV